MVHICANEYVHENVVCVCCVWGNVPKCLIPECLIPKCLMLKCLKEC